MAAFISYLDVIANIAQGWKTSASVGQWFKESININTIVLTPHSSSKLIRLLVKTALSWRSHQH